MYPFFSGVTSVLMFCVWAPPSIIPLKNIKETICFPPNLTLAQTDRSESSNIHKDRQTPTRLYLNSLIVLLSFTSSVILVHWLVFFFTFPHLIFFLFFLFFFLHQLRTFPRFSTVRDLNKKINQSGFG